MKETIRIERMSYGSAAVGHLANGKTLFVEQAAPGDLVTIEIIENKPRFARGHIIEILETSPLRTFSNTVPLSEKTLGGPAQQHAAADNFSSTSCKADPFPCPNVCGGCPWAHLTYQAQLDAKRANVVNALVHTAHLNQDEAEMLVAPCLPSEQQWGYRNKLELNASFDTQSQFTLGFFQAGTHTLTPARTCPLAQTSIANAPHALQGALRFAQGGKDLGIFRIGIRTSAKTGDLEVALWTTPGPFPRSYVAKLIDSSLKTTSIVRVLAEPGKQRKIKGVETLQGRGCWEEVIGPWRFLTSAPSFFQVNTAQAEQLIVEVIQRLLGNGETERAHKNNPIRNSSKFTSRFAQHSTAKTPYKKIPSLSGAPLAGMRIADLYAGGGTFSLPLAHAGAHVIAVESAGSSVRDLRRNAQRNKVDIEVRGGDAARELPLIGPLDALVVDPPRAGLARGMVENIVKASPDQIAYISCDPSTWARDIYLFKEHGYHLSHVQPVDLFPQTYHVETVALMSKREK